MDTNTLKEVLVDGVFLFAAVSSLVAVADGVDLVYPLALLITAGFLMYAILRVKIVALEKQLERLLRLKTA